MRTFPPAFAAQVARRDGAAPVWLLRFTAGGVDYVLCQDAILITPWGITALPLIASWGRVYEGVTNTLSDYRIADLSVNLINNPGAATPLRARAKARQLDGIAASVYLWFDGCSDAPELMYLFRVRDIDLPSEALINLELQDESLRYENYFPGSVVTNELYPDADPDDIGKTIPTIFGTVSKSRALALDAGKLSSIPAGINEAVTSFDVSDAASFLAGMHIMIDDEAMTITGIAADTLTVTRGSNATVPALHQKGAVVWELKSEMIYVVADHPVSSINKIYGVVGQSVINIGPVCTAYPAGNHPNYPGKAVISVPGFITATQAVFLDIVNTLTVGNGTLSADLIGSIARSGSAALSGNLDPGAIQALLGNISPGALSVLSGNLDPGAIQALLGNISPGALAVLSGVITSAGVTALSGNITDYSVNDPTHGHSGTSAISQFATNLPVSRNSVGTFTAITFPALSGARSAVSYQITVRSDYNGSQSATLTISVNGVTYITDSTTWANCVSGKTNVYQFSINSGDFAADSVSVYMNWGSGSSPMVITGGARSISYASTVSNSSTAVSKTAANNGSLAIGSERMFNNGTLAVSGGALPANGTLDVSAGTPATNGTLAVSGGALPANGTLDVSAGTPATNGNLGVTDTITINNGTLGTQLTGNITKTGTVTLTGNSVANTLIGDAILVDVVSSITAPGDVVAAILGVPCRVIGQFPAGYSFNGAITTSRSALAWCHELARQCRAYFRWVLGAPTLIVRPDTLAPVKAINEVRLSNGEMIHGQKLTDINEVINTINLQYNRDWSGGNTAPYKSTLTGTDSASITTYGIRERPELFRFDFVTSDTMAADLLAFYLKWQSRQRWQHTQEAYLFEAALEFGDAVTLAFLEGEIGECTEVGFNPGNGTNIDKIQLTVLEDL